jgi:tol-pal system protein YbgF
MMKMPGRKIEETILSRNSVEKGGANRPFCLGNSVMKSIGLLLSLITMLVIAGCASRGEIETMKRQLEYIERSTVQMQERLVQMDSMYRITIDKNVAYQADLKTALAELLDKSASIDSRLSDIEGRLNMIANRSGQSGSVSTPVTSGNTEPAAAKPDSTDQGGLPQVDQTKLYNNAIADLKEGNYVMAVMEFNEFLTMFKDSPMADDAQYWLGECYYGKKEYAKAIPEFEKVERNYPKGDQMVPALFKMGRSYEELGEKNKAKIIFQRIAKEFPKSMEAKIAQDRLKGL